MTPTPPALVRRVVTSGLHAGVQVAGTAAAEGFRITRQVALGGAAVAGMAAGAAEAVAGIVRQREPAPEPPLPVPHDLTGTTTATTGDAGLGPAEPFRVATPPGDAPPVPDRAADLPVPRWEGRPPGDLATAVRQLPLDDLLVLREWEREHAGRVAVLTMLERRIAAASEEAEQEREAAEVLEDDARAGDALAGESAGGSARGEDVGGEPTDDGGRPGPGDDDTEETR